MQLAILVVVVCAVSGAGSEAAHAGGAIWRLLASVAFLAAAPVAALAFPQAARGSPANGKSPADFPRRLEEWQRVVTLVWMGSSLAVLYVARWPDIVRSLGFTTVWPLVDDMLILAPLLASLHLVWIQSHRLERTLSRTLDPAAALPEVSLRQYLALRWRHHLGLTLLPALLIVGVQESAAALQLTGGADDRRAWWLSALLVSAAVFALPILLRWLWHTQPVLDSPLKRRLLESCRRIGCPVRDIVVWRTGGTVANAAVAGLLPGWRTIFLSDGLIQRLSDDEIDVVVRHEAAHLARRHLWQRLVALVMPLALYAVVQSHCPQMLASLPEQLAGLGVPQEIQTSLLLPAVALAYAMFAVGWLARMHEHDADLAACCVPAVSEPPLGPHRGELAIDSRAVEHLRSALCKLVGGSREYHRRRWFHPSVIERVDFLLRICRQPLLAPHFRARLLGLFWGLLAACLTAIVAGLWPV